MYCHKCGKEISTDSAFCKYCGATLKKSGKKKSSDLIKGITAGIVILADLGTYMGYQYWRENRALNPNISSMEEMFSFAESFNQPIGNWNTSKVTGMWGMFTGAISYSYPHPSLVK